MRKPFPRRPTSDSTLAAGIGLALVVSACGGSDVVASETTAVATVPQPVVVTAVDYGFVNLPSHVEAGTKLTLHNDSDAEVHELVAIRLPDDETRSVAEIVQLPPEEIAAFFPLVETVLVAAPGADGLAVEGTGVLTRPGRYAVICVIPTGADPAEYLAAAAAAEGGPPEIAGGLRTSFTACSGR